MSQVPSTSTSSTDFETIFRAALEEYQSRTKKDIASHPLAAQLQSCGSSSAILAVLKTQVQAFDQSQGANEQWTKWLDPTVNVLYAFSTTLGNGIGMVFPPANAIFAGIAVLLQTVHDVRASKDALLDLFNRMEYFFKRLGKYIHVQPSAAMKGIIVEIMVEVLSILGIVTKEIKQGRTKTYLKKLIGRRGVENALQRLDKLTQEEARMAAAEALVITRGIDDTVKVVDEKVDGVDKRIQDVDGMVKGVNHMVKEVDHAVMDIDHTVKDVDHTVKDVEHTVKNVAHTANIIDHTVTGLDYRVKLLDHSVEGVGHAVKGISHNMKGVDHTVKCIEDKFGLVVKGVIDTGSTIQQMSHQVDDINWNELRKDLRKWIAPPDPSINYNTATCAHHEGTAAWCLKGNTLDWKTSGSLFWIHGKPGSGKTIISSVIIRDIKSMSNTGLVFFAYFYFDFKDTAKLDSRALLSSLLIQLFDQSDIFCDALLSLYSAHKRGSEQPSEDSLAQCLKDMLAMTEQVPIYLVIDALDECPNDSGIPSSREKVLELVKELVELRHSNLRVCITSRPEFDIRITLEPLATQQLCLHDDSGQRQDIVDYVTYVVQSDKKMSKWRGDEKDMVIEKLTEKADGMFRWVFCQLEVLRHCFPTNLRRVLEELPKSLDETYKRILKEINNANREHAYRLLQCLMVASRPLLVEELAEVLAFDLSTGGIPKLNTDWRWEHQEDAVLSACSSLVSIIIENGSRVVQFSHFSVKEFLTSDRLASCIEDVSWFYIPIEPSHVVLAQACLGVLICQDDRRDKNNTKKIPLLRYAAEYWDQHAQIGNVESQIMETMDYFFDMDRPYFSAWVRIRDLQELLKVSIDEEPSDVPHSAAPLYFAAWRGFCGLVERLIFRNSEQVNHLGGLYGTPLHASVLGGHIVVAQLLCAHGAEIHSCSADNWTPLHIASREGHLEMGKWLLDHGADVNPRTKDGWTPLSVAASNGHLEFALMLLECNAEINSRNNHGRTPLLLASEYGHPGVVKIFLDRDADAQVCDDGGNTPLSWAAYRGHHELARMLLKRNVEVDSRDNHGSTPLLLASVMGKADVVRLLLGHNADVQLCNDKGVTALHFAAINGHLDVALILLEHHADINSKDDHGSTPLLFALETGKADIVQLLLDHNADVNIRGKQGMTALHSAAVKGHIEFAQILLEHSIDVNSQDDHGSTPLFIASMNGYPSFVWLLMDYNADVHIHDNTRNTPLHHAARRSHLEISRMLLEHNAEANSQNDRGSTPLLFASEMGKADIVRLLLDHDADVHLCGDRGMTALYCAVANGHFDVALILLEHNADVNSRNDQGLTPLLYTSMKGQLDFVRLLMDHNADVHVHDNSGNTPLHCAARRGYLEISRILLEGNAEVNSENDHDSTPLLLASECGTPDVVRLLLNHNAHLDVRDGDGDTLLHCAAIGDQLEIARFLLELNVEVNTRNDKGSTPLHLASASYEEGHPDVVQLLLGHGADAQARNHGGQTASEVARGPKREEIVQILSQLAV